MKSCYFCKGPVVSGTTDYMARRGGRYTLVKALTAERCVQCGEVYLDPEASRQIDRALANATAASEHLDVPVVNCVRE